MRKITRGLIIFGIVALAICVVSPANARSTHPHHKKAHAYSSRIVAPPVPKCKYTLIKIGHDRICAQHVLFH